MALMCASLSLFLCRVTLLNGLRQLDEMIAHLHSLISRLPNWGSERGPATVDMSGRQGPATVDISGGQSPATMDISGRQGPATVDIWWTRPSPSRHIWWTGHSHSGHLLHRAQPQRTSGGQGPASMDISGGQGGRGPATVDICSVCMCVFVCVCAHTWVCVCVHAHMRVCMCVCVRACMHACVRVCVCFCFLLVIQWDILRTLYLSKTAAKITTSGLGETTLKNWLPYSE